jgi:hypothetical protein
VLWGHQLEPRNESFTGGDSDGFARWDCDGFAAGERAELAGLRARSGA